jgi:hypothetical protein
VTANNTNNEVMTATITVVSVGMTLLQHQTERNMPVVLGDRLDRNQSHAQTFARGRHTCGNQAPPRCRHTDESASLSLQTNVAQS